MAAQPQRSRGFPRSQRLPSPLPLHESWNRTTLVFTSDVVEENKSELDACVLHEQQLDKFQHIESVKIEWQLNVQETMLNMDAIWHRDVGGKSRVSQCPWFWNVRFLHHIWLPLASRIRPTVPRLRPPRRQQSQNQRTLRKQRIQRKQRMQEAQDSEQVSEPMLALIRLFPNLTALCETKLDSDATERIEMWKPALTHLHIDTLAPSQFPLLLRQLQHSHVQRLSICEWEYDDLGMLFSNKIVDECHNLVHRCTIHTLQLPLWLMLAPLYKHTEQSSRERFTQLLTALGKWHTLRYVDLWVNVNDMSFFDMVHSILDDLSDDKEQQPQPLRIHMEPLRIWLHGPENRCREWAYHCNSVLPQQLTFTRGEVKEKTVQHGPTCGCVNCMALCRPSTLPSSLACVILYWVPACMQTLKQHPFRDSMLQPDILRQVGSFVGGPAYEEAQAVCTLHHFHTDGACAHAILTRLFHAPPVACRLTAHVLSIGRMSTIAQRWASSQCVKNRLVQ